MKPGKRAPHVSGGGSASGPPRPCAAVIAVLALAVLTNAPAIAEATRPTRIVSLNLCSDQLLVDLVPRERIAALSFLAADPTVSAVAARVTGIPVLRGATEEVLALDPDLVISAAWSTPATLDLLRRLGRRVVTTPLASSFADIRASIRTLAEAFGETGRGEALIDDLDRKLETHAARDPHRPTAVALQIGSLVSSGGSLLDEAMRWVGLANDAGTRRLGRGGRLPLEALIASPPALLVMANDPDEFRTAAADNLRHPALARLLARTPHLSLPLPTWLCGSPSILTAVERLADARAALLRETAR